MKESVQAYVENSEEATTTQQNLARSLEAELQSMSGNIVKAEGLREQVAEHRETKASLQEKLQATQILLAETKVQLTAFQERDCDNTQRLQRCETELSKARDGHRDPPQIMLRMHDLEVAKGKLETEKASVLHELQQSRQHLQQKENDISSLEAQASGLQSEIEQRKRAEDRLRSGHVALQKQMDESFEVEKRKILESKDWQTKHALLDMENEKKQLSCRLEDSDQLVNGLKDKQKAITAEVLARDQQHKEALLRLENEKQFEVSEEFVATC